MLKRPLSIIAFTFLALLLSGASIASNDAYDQLVLFNLSQRDVTSTMRARNVIAEYERIFPERNDKLQEISTRELDSLFKATSLVSVYSFSVEHVNIMKHVALELQARDALSGYHINELAGAFALARDFDGVDWVRKHWPAANLPSTPQVASSNGNVLRPVNSSLLNAAELDLSGIKIIAVVHPFCGFSKRALSDIASNPEWDGLRGNLELLVPPESRFPLEAVLRWNADHPALPMQFMNRRDDWSMLPSLDTPTFYLLSNGRVLRVADGWPDAAPILAEFVSSIQAGGK